MRPRHRPETDFSSFHGPWSLLLAGMLALAQGSPAAADCALGHQTRIIVSSEVARGGAVLVGLRTRWNSGEVAPDPLFPETLRLSGRGRIQLRREMIAPNLARYVPTRAPRPGTYSIEEVEGTVEFVAGPPPALLAAPTPTAVQQGTRSESYGEQVAVMRLVHTAPRPPGAVAFVVSDAGGAFVAERASGMNPQGSLELPVSTHGCDPPRPAGTRTPPVGVRVYVRYVDGQGRLSPPAELLVTQG